MLDKYLKALLFEHDCVVIPGFGGFVTNYISAEIHPITNKFLPPRKNVAFNEQLRLNDGLLVSYIARTENISPEKAMNTVRGFADSIIQGLKGGNQYILKDIGKFFYNPEHKLEFEPENKVNYAESSFGLTEFFFKPLHTMSATTKPGNKPPVKPTTEAKTEEKKPRKTPVAVFVLIPILLLVGVGAFFYAHKDSAAYSSFNPFAALGNHNQKSDAPIASDSALTDSSAIAAAPVDSVAETPVEESQPVVEAPAAPEPAVGESASQGRFYIIVGSFTEEHNAVKLKDKLSRKGLSPKVISPASGSNYRVSIEDFDNQEKAVEKLNKLRGQFGSAIWLKKI